MNNTINFDKTRNYVYKKCVERVKKRLEEHKLPQITICPADKSLVSDFFNIKCTANNPYLINKRLIESDTEKSGKTGVIPHLKFKDAFEVLWGDEKEFNQNLLPLFTCIMTDLVSTNFEYSDIIETILCDHIMYSEYSTLLHIKGKYNISLLKYYGVLDSAVSAENMERYLLASLNLLYSKENFKELFSESFYTFAYKYKDYKNFDERLEKKYIIPTFIPLLKKYMPDYNSLGLRVKKLIEDDLLYMIEQIDLYSPNYESSKEFQMRRQIVNASSSYIMALEEIATQYHINY